MWLRRLSTLWLLAAGAESVFAAGGPPPHDPSLAAPGAEARASAIRESGALEADLQNADVLGPSVRWEGRALRSFRAGDDTCVELEGDPGRFTACAFGDAGALLGRRLLVEGNLSPEARLAIGDRRLEGPVVLAATFRPVPEPTPYAYDPYWDGGGWGHGVHGWGYPGYGPHPGGAYFGLGVHRRVWH